jgi:hypothetical protein
MFGSLETLGIAAFVLVLVASLPAVPGRAAWACWVAWAAALLAAGLIIARGADALGYRVPARTSEVRKYSVAQLNEATEKNVLLIDGASYTEGGIDTQQLRQELEALGYSTRPVRVALGGANHFERYRLYQDIVASVDSVALPGQRWTFLAEIHSTYDTNPLEQFQGNRDSARAFHYLTAGNAFYAALASHEPDVKRVDFELYWQVARHALVNTFNAGLAERLVPDEQIRAADGRVRGNKRERFAFDAARLLNEAKNPSPAGTVPAWIFAMREPRARALWSRFGVDWVYFGVPGTRVGQLRYIRTLCGETAAPCISPDPALIEALGAPEYWRNAGHLSQKGARVYTAWFARELHRLGLLAR